MIEDGISSMFWHDKIQLAISLKCLKDKVVRRTASQIRKNEYKRGENPETATSRKSLERPEIPNSRYWSKQIKHS